MGKTTRAGRSRPPRASDTFRCPLCRGRGGHRWRGRGASRCWGRGCSSERHYRNVRLGRVGPVLLNVEPPDQNGHTETRSPLLTMAPIGPVCTFQALDRLGGDRRERRHVEVRAVRLVAHPLVGLGGQFPTGGVVRRRNARSNELRVGSFTLPTKPSNRVRKPQTPRAESTYRQLDGILPNRGCERGDALRAKRRRGVHRRRLMSFQPA